MDLCKFFSSKRLLGDLRQAALEIQRLLASPPQSLINSDESGSLTNDPPFVSPNLNPVLSLSEGFNLTDIGINGHLQFMSYHMVDLWRAESLLQYSILLSALNAAEIENSTVAELASLCRRLISELVKLIRTLSNDELNGISSEYIVVFEKNKLRTRDTSLECGRESNVFTHFQTPLRSKNSDLNQTSVFEVVEKMCQQAEEEKETLENDLRNARYDLDRTRESLQVTQKTVSYIKTQLELEKKRNAYLENSFSKIAAVIRGIASKLDCLEPTSNDLQVAQTLSSRVRELITTLPWLRSWQGIEKFPSGLHEEVNPYSLLQQKESELKEKTRALEASNLFINDLAIELKDVKADRARLREDIENKNLLIQKLREEGSEKSVQIDRYRETFDALFEPNTAASFARQVAEQYKRFQYKSSGQNTTCLRDGVRRATASGESTQHASRPGRHASPSACKRSRADSVTTIRASDPISKTLLEEAQAHDKENVPHGLVTAEQCANVLTVAEPKRIRLVQGTPVAPPLSNKSFGTTRLNPQTKRHLNKHQEHAESNLLDEAPLTQSLLSSGERHDPGCPTS